MQKYISYLLNDLEQKIVARWTEQPPHFYGTGMPDPYIQPPEGWDEKRYEYLKEETPEPSFEEMIGEMEGWLENQAVEEQEEEEEKADDDNVGNVGNSMFDKFGLEPQQFPPIEQLSEEDLAAIVLKLLRLWGAYNISASMPEKLPNSWRYKTLLKRMLKPATFVDHGLVGIEFCYYNPEDCPFPSEFCGCHFDLEE